MKPLEGKVAVVAGATRGAGRGIACMLGEAGAIVYCAGRSVRGQPSSMNRPETIEETAEMVTSFGGTGMHVQVDHTEEDQVRALFRRVRDERGRLDILVNDVWGGDALTEWGTPFWKLDLDKGFTMLERAINSHIITSRHGAPLMLERGEGLIVEVTDGDEATNRLYRGTLFYDLVKISVSRLAFAMATELRDTDITAVAVTPGFLRSEAMLELFGVTERNWREAGKKDPHFLQSETPFYVGRAIAALAADPRKKERSGRTVSSWSLMREYGFTDMDGRQPDWGAHAQRQASERWEKLLEVVHADLDDDLELEHDVSLRRLRVRLNPGADPPRWLDHRLNEEELWFVKPEKIAENLAKRYEAALR